MQTLHCPNNLRQPQHEYLTRRVYPSVLETSPRLGYGCGCARVSPLYEPNRRDAGRGRRRPGDTFGPITNT
jgi:hypothetical protein